MTDFNPKTVFILVGICVLNLAAGTMYLFSAYSPQLAIQLGYNASEISRVAICGQSAMVIFGPIVGKVIDLFGTCVVAVLCACCVSIGYFLVYLQYIHEYSNVLYSCVLFIFIGAGSSSMLLVSMKCGLLTLPHHKGIAAGLPNTFFGGSGLFFSTIASLFITGDTANLLFSLSITTLGIFALTLPVVFIVDRDVKKAKLLQLPPDEENMQPVQLQTDDMDIHQIHNVEVEKLVLKRTNFWNLTFVLSFLAGITLMYIYSIGFIVLALNGGSKFFESNTDYDFALQKQQQLQVFLLSLASCSGRLFNSVLGDIVVHKFDKTRLIILVVPLVLTIFGTLLGALNSSYQYLWIMSLSFGFGYGSLYSAMVQITSDLWGVANFSFNWGLLNLSPVLSNLVLSSYIASLYDSHSKLIDIGNNKSLYVCDLGYKCYNSAFNICVLLSIIACSLSTYTYYRVIKNK